MLMVLKKICELQVEIHLSSNNEVNRREYVQLNQLLHNMHLLKKKMSISPDNKELLLVINDILQCLMVNNPLI